MLTSQQVDEQLPSGERGAASESAAALRLRRVKDAQTVPSRQDWDVPPPVQPAMKSFSLFPFRS